MTDKEIASKIQSIRKRILETEQEMCELAESIEDPHENTASDLWYAAEKLRYAANDCLEHRTVPPLG